MWALYHIIKSGQIKINLFVCADYFGTDQSYFYKFHTYAGVFDQNVLRVCLFGMEMLISV